MVFGIQCWLETKVGWIPKLVESQCWLETKVGWTPKISENKMERELNFKN